MSSVRSDWRIHDWTFDLTRLAGKVHSWLNWSVQNFSVHVLSPTCAINLPESTATATVSVDRAILQGKEQLDYKGETDKAAKKNEVLSTVDLLRPSPPQPGPPLSGLKEFVCLWDINHHTHHEVDNRPPPNDDNVVMAMLMAMSANLSFMTRQLCLSVCSAMP